MSKLTFVTFLVAILRATFADNITSSSLRTLHVNIDYTYNRIAVAESGKPCLNNCVYNKCVVSWDNKQEPCTTRGEVAPKYHTAQRGQYRRHCLSNCRTFGYDYAWCFVGQDRSWDYCNPMVAFGYEEYDVYGKRCITPCSKRSEGYTCDTDLLRDRRCALPAWTCRETKDNEYS